MRKLLNTLYITNENAYLSLDGENIVCRLDDDEKFRLPFDNVENKVTLTNKGKILGSSQSTHGFEMYLCTRRRNQSGRR